MISTPFAIDESVFGRDKYMDQPLSATLYVPEGTKTLYEAAKGWSVFPSIVEVESIGVTDVHKNFASLKEYYTIDGRRTNKMQRGINIIRMNDGTVKKVVVK